MPGEMHFVFALPCAFHPQHGFQMWHLAQNCPKNFGLAVIGVFLSPGGTAPLDIFKNIRTWVEGKKDFTLDFKEDILAHVRSLSWDVWGAVILGS